MPSLAQRAARFYVQAIGDGQPAEAVAAYVGDEYIQHNQHVPDGIDGFVNNFAGFLARNPTRRVEVIRCFSDGDFAFLHVLQDLGRSKWATMDVLRFSEGRIVEHWDSITGGARFPGDPEESMAGPTAVVDLEQTDASRARARAFAEALVAGRLDTEALAADFTHRMPGVAPGADGLAAALGDSITLSRLHWVMAQGCFAAAILEGHRDGVHTAFSLLLRLHDGDIAELWDVMEPILPPEKAANTGGKFSYPGRSPVD